VVPGRFELALPTWVTELLADEPGPWPTAEAQMALVLRLVAANVARGTGGPFAAAVFTAEGRLLAVGVNRVEPQRAAIAHAEIVAIALAGQAVGSFDLSEAGATTLVASTEPCAMCSGAVPWSGVTRLVCGARDEDARRIGFDEGYKPADWVEGLRRRGIEVVLDVLRSDAAAQLEAYALSGGTIYNGAPGTEPGPSEGA
jgi:tRNA(Arg) A34 adenosine deaminase TadA